MHSQSDAQRKRAHTCIHIIVWKCEGHLKMISACERLNLEKRLLVVGSKEDTDYDQAVFLESIQSEWTRMSRQSVSKSTICSSKAHERGNGQDGTAESDRENRRANRPPEFAGQSEWKACMRVCMVPRHLNRAIKREYFKLHTGG